MPLHELSGAGNLTWQASISGLLPHFGYGLVLAAKAIDGTTLGTATRHEFYFVPPGSLDTSENGDEARIVAPNFGFDVPDSPACAPHLCGAHNRYRTDKFFKLPTLEGRPQAITAPTTMNCAGGLCRIANGCVAPDRSIRYYRESGSPTPLFVFSNHQGRPTSICGPAHIPMFEHPLADRAARIDQQVEGTTLFLSTGYSNNVGHWNQYVIKLLALRRHAGLAKINRILVALEPSDAQSFTDVREPADLVGLYDIHMDLLKLAFEDSGWEAPPVFGLAAGMPPGPCPRHHTPIPPRLRHATPHCATPQFTHPPGMLRSSMM